MIWIILTFEEEFLFRRRRNPNQPYDWTTWDVPKKLPIGIAAFTSFIIGWIGAILCMSQVYYAGPIAALIPADLGLPVSVAWAALVYPVLRVSETRFFF
jgi:purine-cytosine permease-like protein